MKLRLRLLGSKLDHIHLIQLLLSGHCHISCRNPCLISCDEILQFTDFLLLASVSSLKLSFLHLIHFLEMVIIPHITVQFLILHMINQIDNRIQKRNIVGDKDKCILIILQITLQPFDMFLIQIVGRLIQKQDIRLLQKQLAKQNLGSLTTAQVCNITFQSDIQKPQSSGNFLHLRIDHIEIMHGKGILNSSQLLHQSIHLLRRSSAKRVTDLIHPFLHLKEIRERRLQHVTDGHTLRKDRMLVQIADTYILCPFNLTLIRHQLSGYNIKESRFTFSVGTNQSNMLAL